MSFLTEEGAESAAPASRCKPPLTGNLCACSGSDLTEIAKQAAYLPLRDYLKEFEGVADEEPSSSRPRPIAFDDLASIIQSNKLSKQVRHSRRLWVNSVAVGLLWC